MQRRDWIMLGLSAGMAPGQTPDEDARRRAMLDRLSEEAEIFHANITRVVGTETLRQKAVKAERRFRPRVGSGAAAAPSAVLMAREIVSEFGVSLFAEGTGTLHEVRKVQQVDGKPIAKVSEARMSLALNMQKSDQARRKLLLEFEKYGLMGAAMDFSLSLLMFRKQSIKLFAFEPVREALLGAERAQVLRFFQREGDAQFTVFEGGRTTHQRLQGEVWLRVPDGVPMRVILVAATPVEGATVFDEGRVEYFTSAQGYLLPASVMHRRSQNRALILEQVFTYERFQRFTADAEIRFEEVEPAPVAR